MMESIEVRINLTDRAIGYLGALVQTGLYGSDIEQAVCRIVDEKLLTDYRSGFFKTLFGDQQDSVLGSRCPYCGSPRLKPPEVMSTYDFICDDCGQGSNLSKPTP